MSTVAVNTITDANGGNNARLNGPACPPNSMGFRNRTINGDMRIDQRNNGASVTVTGGFNQYIVDRFLARTNGTNTAQRSTTAPAGFTNSLLFTAGTGAAPASTDVNTLSQRIEGFNIADLAWGTASAVSVTMSFWVRTSLTGTFAFRIGNGSRSYVATYTVNSANTFEYKTVVIPGDTSGTWATDNSVGMFLNWDLGSGSNLNAASANTWVATDSLRVAGSVNLIATSGATFFITGVQLEAGSVATPFERRPFGTELALCQRYYFRITPAASFVMYGAGFVATSTTASCSISYPTSMRVAPTLQTSETASNYIVIHGSTTTTCSTVPEIPNGNQVGTDTARVSVTVASGLTVGQGCLISSNSTQGFLAFASEL
jgi:hypothetical protein